jgi:membrane associated rhomboid family serine protease/DNA-directed RNA polymerase subunit RPC12/RpoP
MNWLILLALVAVFALQVRDRVEYDMQQNSRSRSLRPDASRPTPAGRPEEQQPKGWSEIPGISQDLILDGWRLKRLFGYMWLHGNLFHLLGNMLFLWIFGNALCAKLGNLRYLGLYVLFGVVAGLAQLLSHALPALGASGAINGVVGAYLVLFYQNEITCLFMVWLLIPVYIRWFAVSSMWMIFFWLFWDVVGALFPGDSHVGHIAHLGGFAGGFGIALLMCRKGWITMEKYEKSLLQLWEERKHGGQKESLAAAYAQLGLRPTEEELQQEATDSATPPEPEIVPPSPSEADPASIRLGADGSIRTACACGQPIRVTRQYAGRTVRCPRCRHPVVIPNNTNFFGPAPALPALTIRKAERTQDKHIRFICTCGKRMKAPAHYAGRTVQCPQCGIHLKIPTLTP